MFKKTLIAAAIVVGSAAPAFADVVISPNDNTFVTTSLASVTKQPATGLLHCSTKPDP
ncbi:hypothetical protein V8Z86_07275 [Aeromonas salmonicida subsp. salmonicida]